MCFVLPVGFCLLLALAILSYGIYYEDIAQERKFRKRRKRQEIEREERKMKEAIDARRVSKVVHEDHIYTYSGEDVDNMDKESLVKACKDLIRHGDLNGYI